MQISHGCPCDLGAYALPGECNVKPAIIQVQYPELARVRTLPDIILDVVTALQRY